jgi:hypothetical protein
MLDLVKKSFANQYEAALCMLHQCIRQCPPEHYDGRIANDTFRQITYHTLFWTDYYASANENAFVRREVHTRGGDEFLPTPSLGLLKDDALEYLATCRLKVAEAIAAETAESLEGPSGFSRMAFSRMELYVHSLRHVQHHTAQLSAYLRRLGLGADWVFSGWK